MAVHEDRCGSRAHRDERGLAAALPRRAALVQRLCLCVRFGAARPRPAVEDDRPQRPVPDIAARDLRADGRRSERHIPLSLHDPETGRIAVYYGCADTVTGLAFGYIPEIIDFTKKNNIL
jgi:hypothetical protein